MGARFWVSFASRWTPLCRAQPDQPHVAALTLLLHAGMRPTCAVHSLACLATVRCYQMGPWQGT